MQLRKRRRSLSNTQKNFLQSLSAQDILRNAEERNDVRARSPSPSLELPPAKRARLDDSLSRRLTCGPASVVFHEWHVDLMTNPKHEHVQSASALLMLPGEIMQAILKGGSVRDISGFFVSCKATLRMVASLPIWRDLLFSLLHTVVYASVVMPNRQHSDEFRVGDPDEKWRAGYACEFTILKKGMPDQMINDTFDKKIFMEKVVGITIADDTSSKRTGTQSQESSALHIFLLRTQLLGCLIDYYEYQSTAAGLREPRLMSYLLCIWAGVQEHEKTLPISNFNTFAFLVLNLCFQASARTEGWDEKHLHSSMLINLAKKLQSATALAVQFNENTRLHAAHYQTTAMIAEDPCVAYSVDKHEPIWRHFYARSPASVWCWPQRSPTMCFPIPTVCYEPIALHILGVTDDFIFVNLVQALKNSRPPGANNREAYLTDVMSDLRTECAHKPERLREILAALHAAGVALHESKYEIKHRTSSSDSEFINRHVQFAHIHDPAKCNRHANDSSTKPNIVWLVSSASRMTIGYLETVVSALDPELELPARRGVLGLLQGWQWHAHQMLLSCSMVVLSRKRPGMCAPGCEKSMCMTRKWDNENEKRRIALEILVGDNEFRTAYQPEATIRALMDCSDVIGPDIARKRKANSRAGPVGGVKL